jgi:hypothetical protein
MGRRTRHEYARLGTGAGVRSVPRTALAVDDEQASDLARALCLLAARSESSHPEGQLPPDEPTAILIFGDLEHWIWLR